MAIILRDHEIPEGVKEQRTIKNAWRKVFGYAWNGFYTAYRCPYCNGWISGSPVAIKIDTVSEVGGRKGTQWTCTECHRELQFKVSK